MNPIIVASRDISVTDFLGASKEAGNLRRPSFGRSETVRFFLAMPPWMDAGYQTMLDRNTNQIRINRNRIDQILAIARMGSVGRHPGTPRLLGGT
jgi:hypothetical protein